MAHQLVHLHDVATLLGQAEMFQGGNGLVTGVGGLAKAILKFNSISVCEIFGYSLAAAIGVRVTCTQGFWTREAVRQRSTDAAPGRIGILVKYHEDWRPLTWDAAAALDPVGVARGLTLCTFDRYEWGEFGLSGGQVYFADLERILPIIQAEGLLEPNDDLVEALILSEVAYSQGDFAAVREVLNEAERLNLQDRVEHEFRRMCSIEYHVYQDTLRILGHPLDELLSRYAASVFVVRLNAVAESFDLPTRPVPPWR